MRALVASRLVASRRFVEAASGQTTPTLEECIRQVNRDSNSESCWIRVGLGIGAVVMVAGEVFGTGDQCTVALRLVDLETRVAHRVVVRNLSPCSGEALIHATEEAADELGGGARSLATASPQGAESPDGGRSTPAVSGSWPVALGSAGGLALLTGAIGVALSVSGERAVETATSADGIDAGNGRVRFGNALQYVGLSVAGAAAIGGIVWYLRRGDGPGNAKEAARHGGVVRLLPLRVDYQCTF